MKKILYLISLLFMFTIIYSEENSDIINNQSETMLQEIRRRNGIDPYSNEIIETAPIEQPEITEQPIQQEPVKEEEIEEELQEAEKPDFFAKDRTKFAMGLNLSVQASNSYLLIKDLFQNTLTVDLNKVVEKLPKKGYFVSANAILDLFLNIYIKEKYEFGFFTYIDIYSLINIPKDLINFAANGNPEGKDISGKLASTAYAFADNSFFFGMKIKALSFRVNASWFFPALYLEKEIGNYTLISDSITGRLYAQGAATIKVYSPIPIFGEENPKINPTDFLKCTGFDLGFLGSYNFAPYANLNFGVLNIPIFPARLDKGYQVSYNGSFEIESLVDYVNQALGQINQSSETTKPKPPKGDYSTSEAKYNLEKKYIFRPLKLVVSSDIYPFKNKSLIITPNLGFHFIKPFYIDGGLKIESHFAKVLGAYLFTGREDLIWKHKLGVFLDTRVFRFEMATSVCSPNFRKSFNASGVQLDLGLLVGY